MQPTAVAKTLSNHFLRTILIAMSALGTVMATAGTAAACGPSGQAQPGVVHQAPVFPVVAGRPAEGDSQRGIVGLWHVYYTDSTGAPFYEAYDMWHADGNEWESSFGDPRLGNYLFRRLEKGRSSHRPTEPLRLGLQLGRNSGGILHSCRDRYGKSRRGLLFWNL